MTTHDMAYPRKGRPLVDYGREVETEIAKLYELIEGEDISVDGYSPRWLALKLLEEDEDIQGKVAGVPGGSKLLEAARESVSHLRRIYGDDVDTVVTDRRYGFISGLVAEVVEKPPLDRLTLSDRIDRVVTNRILGIPIFLAAMWLLFKLTTDVAGPYMDWLDDFTTGPLSRWVDEILIAMHAPDWLNALAIDGVIAGVGGVAVFIPLLFFLYFFIALLEDSGYLARAAFVMDRLMHRLGLHGKSFIPMLIGFGCTVPAIYATRTLESRKDRILTALLTPFMSCGARLPVYVLFAAAFFSAHQGWVIWSMYMLGIAMAMASGLLFRYTLFASKERSPFVMELPPYRLPTLRGLLMHMWERSSAFVRKAGTYIFAAAVVIWFLLSLPWGVEDQRESAFGETGHAISPIFAPAGFGEWQAAGSLITGLIAKEVVVSTMSEIYVGGDEEGEEEEAPAVSTELRDTAKGFGVAIRDSFKELGSLIPGVFETAPEEETELQGALKPVFSERAAIAFIVFVLLYIPCVAAMAAFGQEFGWRWAAFAGLYLTGVAWVAAVVVYQGARLFGLG
jgi:ferrous iron transport protein B